MIRARAAVLWSALAAQVACGSDSIVLSTSPAGTRADGETLVEVRAEVTSLGEPAPDGTRIWFRASEPLLFASPEDAWPSVAGGLVPGQRELELEVRGGAATVFVRAPIAPITINVDARYVHEDGTSSAASAGIPFGAPPPVSSGRLEDTRVVTGFSFGCDADRVGGFVDDRPDIRVRCEAVTRAHDGAELHHVPIWLYAEAGELIELAPTATSPRQYEYVIPSLLEARPVDVRPLEIEQPFAQDGRGPIPGAVETNPRDGLVTLLAVTRGHEAYTDVDGNGSYDEGEPFLDEGEPFLDVDDDGVWTPEIDGPHCCDSNGNGEVDGPNGRWDGDVWLGRVAHVMWTGPVAIGPGRSEITPADPTISPGASTELELTVVDAHFNPVAFRGPDDGLTLVSLGLIGLYPPPRIDHEPSFGVPLRDQFPEFRFAGSPIADDQELRLEASRRWSITVRDEREDEPCSEKEWNVFVEVLASPFEGDAMPTRRDELRVTGVLESCPPG